MNPPIKTPGVYINEINAFPNSVVPIASAVPAFIGYTPQAAYEGKSYTNVPMKISSFAEFQTLYDYPDPAPPKSPAKPYRPGYYLVKQKAQPEQGDYMLIGSDYYAILPDPSTIYYLYNSVQLFYENGGGDAYIVSVGTYGAASGNTTSPGDQIVNPHVQLNDLLNGLALLKNEQEPTMYICPEATLLSVKHNGTLMKAMLLQNQEMGTAISLFDIIGARDPDPILYTEDIETFRSNTGSSGLSYGAAYYPFLGTTLMQAKDIDYTNLFGGDIQQLATLINSADAPNSAVATILDEFSQHTVAQNHQALMNASTVYASIIKQVLAVTNVLPPSGAIAGVITATDNNVGPWQAPANVSVASVTSLPILLNDAQQASLNVDAVSGKSINAIRHFNGLGILIWGARTLDGNSLDWQYLPVRRTVTYLEQSCKLATHPYIFQPNIKNTWEAIKTMIGSFLTTIWSEGGLQGASPADAFSVDCGLGTTMTAEDISNGILRVMIKVAIVRPAEFIVISFSQEMANDS